MMLYPVTSIFASLQGEGHFVGYRMAFVRLAGCSVTACRIRNDCDEGPWKAQWTLRVVDIVDRLKFIGPFAAVCITGGEPTDHDLLPLISALRDEGWPVHLETSGERKTDGYPLDWVTVSPKTNEYQQRVGHALKIVVMPEWREPWGLIKGASDSTSFFHYYLQPLYRDGGPVNLPEVIAMLGSDNNGRGKWALSTQAHKVWGIA